MAPKKKGEEPPPVQRGGMPFVETEKALFEQQIADLNRKLARLRTEVGTYQERNKELQHAYDQLDEDRADIIAYLKKTLNLKNEENTELKDKVKGMEELREIEMAEFKRKVTELENNFTTMKDQLTSENKLLGGKLNTLEEFRAIREDLLKKFEKQERAYEDQEMKYRRIIYENEKKFVVGKDKLKREMEGKLLQLAQDFQDASESRIAASTHRVIRENIALNNQLDNLLYTQAKVAEQNEKYKEDATAARNALEVAEAERDKAINKSIVQRKVIDQLTIAFQTQQKTKAIQERKNSDFEKLESKIEKITKENESMILKIRILEQNLHANQGEQNKYVTETQRLIRERDKYKNVIKDTVIAIQAALKVDKMVMMDPNLEITERKMVLKGILSVISKQQQAIRTESVESLISFSQVYETGDLGFVPKTKLTTRKSRKTSISTVESMKTLETERSSPAIPASIASVGSLKTVPSISVMPIREDVSITTIPSIPSFTVTSLHSDIEIEPEPKDSFEDMTDIEKQLAISKLEIQKSILKDLEMSQAAFHSKSRVEFDSKLSMAGSKQRLSLEVHEEEVEGEEKGEEVGDEHVGEEHEKTDEAPGNDTDKAGDEEEKEKETPAED